MKAFSWWARALLATSLSGCLTAPTDDGGVAAVAGTWSYSGQQTSATTGSLSGTLTLTSQSNSVYNGSIDITETIAGSAPRRIAGPLTGRLVNTSSVDFTVTLGTVDRQHVGTFKADTIAGTWFEMASGGAINGGGTFRAVRTAR